MLTHEPGAIAAALLAALRIPPVAITGVEETGAVAARSMVSAAAYQVLVWVTVASMDALLLPAVV